MSLMGGLQAGVSVDKNGYVIAAYSNGVPRKRCRGNDRHVVA